MGTAGILPRSMDVIFNSIDGLQGDGRVSILQPSQLSDMILSYFVTVSSCSFAWY